MKKLKVELKYCYGISKLSYEFCFDEKHRTYAIYAPNGSMKTSFAKTFHDYSQSQDSADLIFKDRATKREITEEEAGALEAEQVSALTKRLPTARPYLAVTLGIKVMLLPLTAQNHLSSHLVLT